MPIKRPPADIPGYMELRKQFSGAEPPAPAAEQGQPPQPRPAPPSAPVRPEPPQGRSAGQGGPSGDDPALSMPESAPRASGTPSSGSEREKGVVVKGSVAVPRQGHDPAFDAAVASYGVPEALRMFIDSGMPGFLGAVRAGALDELAPVFPREGRAVQIARVLPADVVRALSARADPLGLQRPSRTAGVILTQILIWQLGRMAR